MSSFFAYALVAAVMNSPATLPSTRVDAKEALEDRVELTLVQPPEAANDLTAPNRSLDPEPRTETMSALYFPYPLRALAIGTACLLATMAAVIAFG